MVLLLLCRHHSLTLAYAHVQALPDGSVVQIGEVVAGEFVGEMGFLKESNRVAAATVVARKGPYVWHTELARSIVLD